MSYIPSCKTIGVAFQNKVKLLSITNIIRQYHLTQSEIRNKRSQMFTEEKARQKTLIPRIEKIEVNYVGIPEDCTLLMNKKISTPFHCAMHLSEALVKRCALAEVDSEVWDMHRPLEDDCTLKLLHFHNEDPHHLNLAFWRSCSFLLGMVVETAFKEELRVQLHSFPFPNVKSGSFTHDVDMNLESWSPTKDELRLLSAMFVRLGTQELDFERLVVDASLAAKMFENNSHKVQHIPQIAAKYDNNVTLYRVGDHVDISRGPMISNTRHLGRSSLPAVHKVETEDGSSLYRFQGVALPTGMLLNHFAFGVLEKRASKLNTSVGLKLHAIN